METELMGKKRTRNKNEETIYSKINTPDILENPINYFLSQIIKEYEEGISYYFSFDGYAEEDIIVSCIWGFLPVYDGAIANFTKRVKIDDIASYINFGKMERIFDFFSNIQCLINVDNDTFKKLSFFENGKYGFIFKGKKDYFLLMNIKSLDKFEYIDKNSDYCQFWLIKIDDYKILQTLNLKSTNKQVLELTDKVGELKRIIEEKDSYFQNERAEYIDRIKKLNQDNDNKKKIMEEQFIKEIKEKEELIEKFKADNKNRIQRIRKFIGLKIHTDCFSIIEEDLVRSFEELPGCENEESSDDHNDQYICILCGIRSRNIFFEKCGHCCICEECIEKLLHKFDKKKKVNEYFCPICNNLTKQDGQTNYSGIRKIFYS